jgi:hypothetical protein
MLCPLQSNWEHVCPIKDPFPAEDMLHCTCQYPEISSIIFPDGPETATGISLLIQKHWLILETGTDFFTRKKFF